MSKKSRAPLWTTGGKGIDRARKSLPIDGTPPLAGVQDRRRCRASERESRASGKQLLIAVGRTSFLIWDFPQRQGKKRGLGTRRSPNILDYNGRFKRESRGLPKRERIYSDVQEQQPSSGGGLPWLGSRISRSAERRCATGDTKQIVTSKRKGQT